MKSVFLLTLIKLIVLSPFLIFAENKKVLICGAGGFIGHHLVKRYKQDGCWVRGVDIKYPEFESTQADEFFISDLRDPIQATRAVTLVNNDIFDEVIQLAANMGGMGFISSHDAEIMHDSGLINLNILEASRKANIKKIFFSSSACIYPEENQLDPEHPQCSEETAYPANPDTEYGWEKLFSERLYLAYGRDYGMKIYIARLHNVFGPLGTWEGGREKAPAALCRKVICAQDGESIEIWGKGDQTRSFLYIDECVEGIRRIMKSEKKLPVLNLGSDEKISINKLASLIIQISNKKLTLKNVPGPEGVRGRNSVNTLIQQELNWRPSAPLKNGIKKLYFWIEQQVKSQKRG